MTSPRRSATFAVLSAVCSVLVLVLVGAFVPAQAHASLTGSSPAQGASLTRAPTKVVLRYDENIREPSVVIVNGPDGTRVDRGGTRVVDNTATVNVSVRLQGTYAVAYRVISADGHPVSSTVRFSFHGRGAPTSATVVDPPAPRDSTARTSWIVGGGAVLVVLLAVVLMTRRRPGGRAGPPAGGGSTP